MTLPVHYGQPILDPAAAAQQLAGVACVYQARPDKLAELFAPAQVVRFVHRETTWPPSYAVLSWPDSQHLIIVAGTTNLAPQVLGHIAGSFGRPGDPDPVTVNGQWAAVWEVMREEIRPLIGDLPANGHVYVSGHSYGAAVAAIAAVDYAGRWGGERVSLLQIGSPKTFTPDRPHEFPHVWQRLESTDDPVPTLPPTLDGVDVILNWADPLSWLPRFPQWVHYGIGWTIYPNGEFAWPYANPDPLPPGVSTSPLDAHRLRNHWGRLAARYVTHGGSDAYTQALDICDQVLAGPVVQTETPELPRVVPGPDGTPFTVPDYAGITVSPLFSSGATMPPIPVELAEPYYKVTHFFNWNEAGWDESYWVNAVGGTNPMLTAVNWGIELVTIRKKALWNQAKYVGLRVSTLEKPHVSTPDKSANTGFGTFPSTVNDKPLPKGSCVFARQQDESFTYDAERVYRGITEEFLGVANINATKFTPTPRAVQWLQQMNNFLRAGYGGPGTPGGATVQCGILAVNKGAANPVSPVSKVDVDAAGFLRITTPNDVFPVVNGSRIHLAVTRTRCARGISGRYIVRSWTNDATGKVMVLNKKPHCDPANLVTLLGEVRLIPRLAFQTYWLDFSAAGHRNTGAPNFSTAGRRPSKC